MKEKYFVFCKKDNEDLIQQSIPLKNLEEAEGFIKDYNNCRLLKHKQFIILKEVLTYE